jgi:uncharacterized protein YuzE
VDIIVSGKIIGININGASASATPTAPAAVTTPAATLAAPTAVPSP